MELVDSTCANIDGCPLQCKSVAFDGTRATLVATIAGANGYKLKLVSGAWDYFKMEGSTDVAVAGVGVSDRKTALGYTSNSIYNKKSQVKF
jgi:hypothetical protein